MRVVWGPSGGLGCPAKVEMLLQSGNSQKGFSEFVQIHFAIWTNTYCQLHKYGLGCPAKQKAKNAFAIRQFAKSVFTFQNLYKYMLQSGQIHCQIDKYGLWGSYTGWGVLPMQKRLCNSATCKKCFHISFTISCHKY